MNTVNLFSYSISNKGCKGDIDMAFKLSGSGRYGFYMACANPHSLVTAASDPLFQSALKFSDILLPDGTGIILAAKLLKLPLTEKVAGSDFFRECNKMAQIRGGIRYFFLGSSQKVLDLIEERLKREYPDIIVCGTYSPPFNRTFGDNGV